MEFTNAEKERINELYGNDFLDITPGDAPLIAKWERFKAVNADEHLVKTEALITESRESLLQAEKQAAFAMETLELCRDEALARLEAVSNGQ